MPTHIVTRQIDGTKAYFRKFGTPRNKQIKGKREWTFDPLYAQEWDHKEDADRLVTLAGAMNLKVEVR